MALAIAKGRKLGMGRVEGLLPQKWPMLQISGAKGMFQVGGHSGTSFLSAWDLVGQGREVILVRSDGGDIWGRLPGPVHNLAWTLSQIPTAYTGTEVRSRGQIPDKNGPSVGVNRPVRLQAASFRKPNQIGSHSRGCVMQMSQGNQTLYIAWLGPQHSSETLLAHCGLLTLTSLRMVNNYSSSRHPMKKREKDVLSQKSTVYDLSGLFH